MLSSATSLTLAYGAILVKWYMVVLMVSSIVCIRICDFPGESSMGKLRDSFINESGFLGSCG